MICDHYDEESGFQLDPELVTAGIVRELEHMSKKQVAHKHNRAELRKTDKVWSGRWCGRSKGGTARMRYVVRQFRSEWQEDAFCGTPDWMGVRVLLVKAVLDDLEASVGDFCTAFMSTCYYQQIGYWRSHRQRWQEMVHLCGCSTKLLTVWW